MHICHYILFLLKLSPHYPQTRWSPLVPLFVSFLSSNSLPFCCLCPINSITLRSPTAWEPRRAVCTSPQMVLSIPSWPKPITEITHSTMHASHRLLRICSKNLLALWRLHSCAQNLSVAPSALGPFVIPHSQINSVPPRLTTSSGNLIQTCQTSRDPNAHLTKVGQTAKLKDARNDLTPNA